MRRFRARPRPDTVVNERRHQGVIWTRILYLTILAGLTLWLLDFLFGSYVYLKSEGMVAAPQATVATEFPATVRSIIVREGDIVSAGDLIAVISSQEVAESVARLTSDLARLHAEEANLRVGMEKNAAVVRLAGQRSEVANEIRRRYESLERDGILPSDKRLAAIDSEYRSLVDFEAARIELSAIRAQLKQVTPAIDEAESALRELKRLYRNGEIVAPIDGIVGRRNVEAGSVTRAGEPMLEIYGGNVYVLAYLPAGTLYSVEPGQGVTVEWGVRRAHGRIAAIEPVAIALPNEFQTAFKPRARSQILRIEFDSQRTGTDDPRRGKGLPPLFAKVKIHGRGPIGSILGTIF